MDSDSLLLVGSGVILLWGVGHLVPTREIVAGFGSLTSDNRHILTMEWVAEGLTLIYLGALVMTTTLAYAGGESARFVVLSAAGMLVALAVLSALTGARTKVLPMRICPLVKLTVAALFVIGSL